MNISIICIYNNEYQLNEQFLPSLKKQGCNYELILIDNRTSRFKSASSALNYGANKATGDILIFSHQDIALKTKNELYAIATIIEEAPNGSIVGTQGVRDKNKKYYSNITAGKQYIKTLNNEFELKPIEVSCVDEGFFGMKKTTWEMYKFDEDVCNDWHLYCVEICLKARKNGNKVFVAPIQLHHFSYGNISNKYMENLKELCKVYRNDFKYIWTTCYKVRTNSIYINCLVGAWKINRLLRGKK